MSNNKNNRTNKFAASPIKDSSAFPISTNQNVTLEYESEDSQTISQKEDSATQQTPLLSGMQNNFLVQNQEVAEQTQDEELKKKIALYYHSLFQGCLGQWFVLMQQNNYNKLSKRQYIELNIRIQKSLILDFEVKSAQESALEDWKIDIEREVFNKVKSPKSSSSNAQKQQSLVNLQLHEQQTLDYERLSEFFFDLCLSWCQYLDVETFLFFLNGVFLNITKGNHINVSTFKELDEIEVLSIEFFNILLNYRNNCEHKQQQGETYREWYNNGFGRVGEIIKDVEGNLQEALRNRNEHRILDLWIEMPKDGGLNQNSYINQHFDKLDKDLRTMNNATKAQDKLAQSITMMEHIKKINANNYGGTLGAAYARKNNYNNNSSFNQAAKAENTQQITQRTEQTQQYITMTSGNNSKKGGPLRVTNNKIQKQEDVQRQILGQFGDKYKHAKLLEVSENSYLIINEIRLPIFGQKQELIQRTKSSISKMGYLLKLHPEYTNHFKRSTFEENRSQMSISRGHGNSIERVNQDMAVNNNQNIGNRNENSQIIPPIIISNATTINNNKNVVYEKLSQSANMAPIITSHRNAALQERKRESLGKDTLESENDMQLIMRQQLASAQYEDSTMIIPNNGIMDTLTLKNLHSGQQQLSTLKITVPPPQDQFSGAPESSYSRQNQFENDFGSGTYQQHDYQTDQNQDHDDQNSVINRNEESHIHDNVQIHNMHQSANNSQEALNGAKSPNQVDERALQAVYDRYLQLLKEDQNAKIETILREEPFVRQFSGKLLDEREIEQAVLERLYAEEEGLEVQDMIAKFYKKFDELHEQSVGQVLAKSPNKIQVKNEIKYKIPERWTKKFHKHDVIPLNLYKKSAVDQERGKVNRRATFDMQAKILDDQNRAIYEQQQQMIPLSNSMLKESLSSRATPKSDYRSRGHMPGSSSMIPAYAIDDSQILQLQQQQQQQQVYQQQVSFQKLISPTGNIAMGRASQDVSAGIIMGGESALNRSHQPQMSYGGPINRGNSSIQGSNKKSDDIEQQSMDTSKIADQSTRQNTDIKSSGQCAPQHYDWSEVAHLFDNGEVPEDLLNITDPIEYNYLLVRLKKDFNDKNKSEYIKYMNLSMPYHSRRDEVGGRISKEEWNGFVDRLEGIIEKVQRKRRRIIKRRKKKGIKKLPRKTLFKPIKKLNLANDPLWNEVFLDQSQSEESEDDNNIDIALNQSDIYQIANMSQKAISVKNARSNSRLTSGKLKQRHVNNNLDISTYDEFSLPPIMRPLLHDNLRDPARNKSSTGKLRTAEMNLKETVDKYPATKNMLNIKYKDYYQDPFDKQPHKASRMIAADTPMIKRIEHNYSKKLRSQMAKLNKTNNDIN